MTPHPHAEVLRAIADGVPLSEFEGSILPGAWAPLADVYAASSDRGIGWIDMPDKWQIRRKPQHIMVNGFKVPKPLDVAPEDGCVYTPFLQHQNYADEDYFNTLWAIRSIERGIGHATRDAAIAHAKAMLGIDPEYFK